MDEFSVSLCEGAVLRARLKQCAKLPNILKLIETPQQVESLINTVAQFFTVMLMSLGHPAAQCHRHT